MGTLTAYIALGSNLGDSRRILEAAIARLQAFSRAPIRRSARYATAPVDCPPGSPTFLNAAVALEPLAGETPESLLPKLQALEGEFGRLPKKVVNEARPLDLDLVAFGSERRNSPQLTLPHPRAHRRRFVLQPLHDLDPDLVLPGQTQTVSALLKSLPPETPACVRAG